MTFLIELIMLGDFIFILHKNLHTETFFGIALVFLRMLQLWAENGIKREKYEKNCMRLQKR